MTLGCARNDVDSEELAGRLGAAGWSVSSAVSGDADGAADVVLVNTCGFVDSAKKDSIDAVLEASGGTAKVVAVGCLAERYGHELAEQLPEAAAVLGFDRYTDLGDALEDVLAGRDVASHTPRDRRTLLPISPAARPAAAAEVAVPGHAWLPTERRRLSDSPVASLKLASGCDRRCTFCAIPAFRGSFVSRPPAEVLAEATWLANHGAREITLVSENSTSYGKDLGDLRALETLLPQLAAVPGLLRLRVAYLQPAEVRPGLLEAIAATPKVAPYFDLSFQHASASVLRRMRRFGSLEAFVDITRRIRALAPTAGIRSNVIVGFPGETEDDLAELVAFLEAGRLDAIGVFGYSDEDGTEAEHLDGHLDQDEIDRRVEYVTAIADELMAQRAEDRIGELIEVLVEEVEGDLVTGRAAHQGPDGDGTVTLTELPTPVVPGDVVVAEVVATEGVDLIAATRIPAAVAVPR